MSFDSEQDLRQVERRSAALWNIRIDVATGRLVAALRECDIESIILKGPALRDLYPAGALRTYMDGDVWVAPDRVALAGVVLDSLGYQPKLDERGLPDWWLEHASSWRHRDDGTSIDLHRRLQGVGVSDRDAWELLRAEAEHFELGGEDAMRLGRAATALHLALHAGHHGAGHPSALAHVEVACSALDERSWERAVTLASELQAIDLFTVGLRLVLPGTEVADRLGLPSSASVTAHLQASGPPPVARGFEQLSTSHTRAWIEIVLKKFFPPPGFIRYWWRPASRGPLLLFAGYLYRPFWLIAHAPGGWRAWRRARAESRGPRPDPGTERPD